ncbi:MAG: hypothetical protein QM763_12825 [Agriterribacter sp.]
MQRPIYIIIFSVLISCNTKQIKSDALTLNNELHNIYRLDQQYREQLSNLPPTSTMTMELWKKQNLLDSINLIRVTKVLDSIGFPHKPLFDDSAGTATFMVIQHATLQQQEKYLPLFQTAADQNQIKPSLVALMVDRVRVGKGQKQIYGTQAVPIKDPKTGYMTDKYELAPIEDEENVNQRRLKVGLPTIEEGAKELGVDYMPKKKSGS